MDESILDRETLLEIIREGRLVIIDGRTAHDEDGVDFLLSAALAVSSAASEEATTPLNESEPSHETIVSLLPGVAVYCSPGAPVPFSEGARWLASGDFKCFLEAGDDNNPGLFRELLVGPFRAFDNDNDHELPEGNFLDEPGWDEWVGNPQRVAFQLARQIGFDPNQPQPDDALPRGETWLAERSNWETEVDGLKEHITELEDKLTGHAPSTTPSAFSANALELIQAAGGLSKPKAEAVLAALKATQPTDQGSLSSESQG